MFSFVEWLTLFWGSLSPRPGITSRVHSQGGGLPHSVGHSREVPLAGHGKRMSVHRGQARVSLDRIRRFHLKDAGFSTMKGLCLTESSTKIKTKTT